MSRWGGGYVTDITYMSGYYRQQSPRAMAAACLLSGIATDLLDAGDGLPAPSGRAGAAGDDLSYVELGCGHGLGALVLAASNPGWRVTAIDFNPAHIAHARGHAAATGIDNITFLEADLSALTDDAIAAAVPPADVVSLHGLWSWVGKPVQDGIVRLLRSRVRPGGLVHVSYNAAPAWQGMIAMQRLMREAGLRLGTRSDRQVAAGVATAQELMRAGAANVAGNKFAEYMVERLGNLSPEYLAHEYMNDSWAPAFHADVAEALSAARLDYVGSVEPTENVPDLLLNPAQRAVYDRFEEPVMRELIKDLCIGRGLRHDLYVRGARRLTAGTRDAALRGLTVALTVPAADFRFEVDMPAGKATLNEGFYRPVVAALAGGPRRVETLLDLPDVRGQRDNPAELLTMLLGTDQALVLARPEAPLHDAAIRFNAVTARMMFRPDQMGRGVAFAAPRVGAGLACGTLEMFLLDRVRAAGGAVDPDALLFQLGPSVAEDKREELRARFARALDSYLPIWRTMGLA